MPLCTPFPGPLSVLVMDNAQILHGEGILQLAEQFSKKFLFSLRKYTNVNHKISVSNFCHRIHPT